MTPVISPCSFFNVRRLTITTTRVPSGRSIWTSPSNCGGEHAQHIDHGALAVRHERAVGPAHASASVNPVSDSARGFMLVMHPLLSVAMTPSPMLASVVRRSSARSAAARSLLTMALPDQHAQHHGEDAAHAEQNQDDGFDSPTSRKVASRLAE